jgi:hypothetical protein
LLGFIAISSVINRARGQYERSFLLPGRDDNDRTDFLRAQVKVIQQPIASLHAYLERWDGEAGALRRAGFPSRTWLSRAPAAASASAHESAPEPHGLVGHRGVIRVAI